MSIFTARDFGDVTIYCRRLGGVTFTARDLGMSLFTQTERDLEVSLFTAGDLRLQLPLFSARDLGDATIYLNRLVGFHCLLEETWGMS